MGSDIKPKAPLRELVINEFKELLILTGYLFVTIGAMNLMKAAVLHTHGIDASYWGVGIVKAVLLAKFVMLGKVLKIAEHNADSPLIWRMLHKAFIFFLFLIALTIVEEVVMGFFHHQTIGDSLGDLFGTRLVEALAGALILLLVLIPYFAFQVLAEALGEGRLVRMFLIGRDAAERQ